MVAAPTAEGGSSAGGGSADGGTAGGGAAGGSTAEASLQVSLIDYGFTLPFEPALVGSHYDFVGTPGED